MLLNNYLVEIPEGIEGTESRSGYVGLKHNQKYKIFLDNQHSTRCNAEVYIDGKHQGTWRLGSWSRATLEHPAHDSGCFTFYKLDSIEAQKVQLQDNAELGLLKVVFTPEMQYAVANDPDVLESFGFRSDSKSIGAKGVSFSSGTRGGGASAGGTGLTGWSQQKYGSASEMPLDETQKTIIYLRLVCLEEENQDEPRPLISYSSPIPPRI